MLGTPNEGSHAIAALLLGRDPLVKKLALLDLEHDHAALLGTIAAFAGVLDLLPHAGSLDLFEAAGWEALFEADVPAERGPSGTVVASAKSAGFAWSRPAAAALARARRVRDLVRSSPLDPARTVYVAGAADQTPSDVIVDASAPPGRRVRVMGTAHGDGRVPWSTGIPKGLRTYYLDAPHGDLASTEAAFPALLDLLATGTTSKLPSTPPGRRSADDQPFEIREPLPPMVPDEEELLASALGKRPEPVRPAEVRPRVQVRIVHDNITNAVSPVLVGHYQQDVIVAAERYLDRQLSHRLSDLLRMELYPGPPGTAVVVLNDDETGARAVHPGAVIAGLGTVGDLTPGRLTATLAHALTAYGAECVGRERRRRQREGIDETAVTRLSAPVTAVLVGSGEGGVTLADSVQALLRGVARANERLQSPAQDARSADGSAGAPVTAYIDRVDVFELYEDRAIEAVYALRSVAQSADLSDFVVEELLVTGDEGLRRARTDTAQDWWQRVRVTSETAPGGGEGLRFEALTQLARAEARLAATQRRAVEGFVGQAIGTTAADPQLGTTLFELLVPNAFKVYAPDRRKLVLVLDPRSAALPWELMQDRYEKGSRPLSVASGMIRQLLVEAGREQVARAPANSALVIGDPIVTDDRFAPLPGAAQEAQAVAEALAAQGYDVLSLVGAAAHPLAVLSALHEQPWRVVHLAAHGVFEFAPEDESAPVSGLVLDDGIFVTAAEVEQMRHVPELVFVNCCHLGQTRGDAPQEQAFHRLAANLATQFIRMGARAVVAAGWAVNDAAATTFARAFYEALFQGVAFGDAVLRAREQTFAAHGGTNTWGAYQCYGDPAFSLVRVTGVARAEAPAAATEMVYRAQRIARSAREADEEACAALRTELQEAIAMTPAGWWGSPVLCAAVGEALGELGAFDEAVRYYERVTTAERADAPLRAIEQLASVKVRWAAALASLTPPETRKSARLLNEAERLLKPLLAVGETAERHALMGALQKRRAIVATGEARRRALSAMREAYAASFAIAGRDRPSAGAYALENRLAADVVAAWRPAGARAAKSRAAAELDAALALMTDIAGELGRSSTAFFDLSAAANALMLSALAAGALDDARRERIEAAYRGAMRRGVSPRERRSMLDQIGFFAAMARTELEEPRRDALVAQLERLAEALGSGPVRD
jgi:hypothetical protein